MDFKLLDSVKLKIIMKECLEECIESFGEDIKTTIGSPGGHNLFNVDDTLEILDTEKSEIFHHIVAKLLFVVKRARIDIEPTVSLLYTRVSKSMQEGCLKLRRLLCYF